MMLELNDVMAIIAKNNEAMNNVITKWEVEEGDEYPEGLTELRRIVNVFTAQICRAIVKAEDALVGDTLEGMEKSEKDNESKIDIKEGSE